MTTNVPTEHAALGASASHRWMECAGSIRLGKDIPDTSSPYAREGTAAHDLAADLLLKGGRAEDRVGEHITVSEQEGEEVVQYEIEVTDDMAVAVQGYVDLGRELAAMSNVVRVEERFDLAPLKPPAPMFGTADFVCYDRDEKHLHVLDYKHGQGVVVEAKDNPQLRYYALGAVVTLKIKPETITVHVYQPRAHHESGEVHRTDTFSWEDLVAFKETLFEAAAATQEDDAPLNPGEHCRFCPALAVCPAQAKQATAVAQAEFGAVVQEGQAALPTPESLTDRDLRVVLDAKKDLEKWLAAVYDYVRDRLERGEEFEGYKLVPKRASRKWLNEDDAGKYLQRKLGKKGAYELKLLSPAKAEKALKAEEGEIPTYLEKLYEAKSSGYNLAPDEDAREGVDLIAEAQEEFAG